MLAYLIPTENRYVRTQGEAKKLGFGEATDIPTDKEGLLDFVNGLRKELRAQFDTPYGDDLPEERAEEIAIISGAIDPEPPMSATPVLSRMDNPTLDLDGVIEAIFKMKGGHALKRVASAVALKFEELAK